MQETKKKLQKTMSHLKSNFILIFIQKNKKTMTTDGSIRCFIEPDQILQNIINSTQ